MHRLGRTKIWQTQTDTKIRVIETLFYIQFQGLCLKVWVWNDYLWARKVQEMKLSYYIRFRSLLDSVQKVHSQKLLKVKDRSICRLPEPWEPLLARFRKEFGFINFNNVCCCHTDVWFQASEIWVTSDGVFMTKYKKSWDYQTLCTSYLGGTCWLNVYRTREKFPVLPLSRTSPRQAHYSSTVFV